jgi:predicted enzyme related to lactoylglutathione lyase
MLIVILPDPEKMFLIIFWDGQRVRGRISNPERSAMANPFVHVELNTTDIGAAKTFYGKLFGWKLDDVPMGSGSTYTMIGVGEGTGGGMQAHPVKGAPSGWLAYVTVDDLKASTEKARQLGAKVMQEPIEVMGMGSLSVIIDPTGAALGLWQPAARK